MRGPGLIARGTGADRGGVRPGAPGPPGRPQAAGDRAGGGSCWAVALISSRAWTWPVPVAAALVPGLALVVVVVVLLAFATRSTQ